MPHIGVPELLVVLLILVLLFGASRLPQIGRGLGEGIRNFRSGVKDSQAKPPADEPREADDRAAS